MTPLERAIDHAAHVLPAQGPITVFIHHNTLHAFEEMSFEEAVVAGGDLLGCEPWLPEERYREELNRGRIREEDLRAVLRDELSSEERDPAGGSAPREELQIGWLVHGVPKARGAALEWLLSETPVLEKLREDLPAAARARLLGGTAGREAEGRATRALWMACLAAVARGGGERPAAARAGVRHRDHLLAATGADTDDLVHPLLIRLCAAYLDQGIAVWPMPLRERGFFRSVVRLYGEGLGPPSPWMRLVRRQMAEEAARGHDALASIEASLEDLGVGPSGWEAYLASAALALRGWAGMIRQVEVRPDRVPVIAPPASLADFLAVRLILDRAAAAEIIRTEIGRDIGLARVREDLAGSTPGGSAARSSDADTERAWALFHLSQIAGRTAGDLNAMGAEELGLLFDGIAAFDSLTRRRLMHLAYERRLKHAFYDAVATHPPSDVAGPRFQALFCIDEREESLRRHLEEVAPRCTTAGAAGFFGVAMYYKGADEVHARPLCPVGIRPEHEVEEVHGAGVERRGVRGGLRRAWGQVGLEMALGSRTVVRGTVTTVLAGALAAVPLLFRVLAPKTAARMLHRGRRLLKRGGRPRLALERREIPPSLGSHSGFTAAEMTAIVSGQIRDAGLALSAPLVMVIGHRSTSLNNPHESAHDCGACGGGGGGPNARAFAMMANHPEVRRLLAAGGLEIPGGTWFVGGEHNTATDGLEFFDLDRVPSPLSALLGEAMGALEEACRRDAHERCRRFLAVPPWYGRRLCLGHVETRAEDLAQTRPEYGHASNAWCVVGRRSRTRGLFMDRRAFLVSYDPSTDDEEATILRRVLAGIVPVVAGISLEYWFGYVDPTGYGCGTKLPHNVSALLGVMDGHASDLRTGLPRQMTEIHEPVRLAILVEAAAPTLRRIVEESPELRRLVGNRWITLAALDPHGSEIVEMSNGRRASHAVESPSLPVVGRSAEWYAGKRGFLGFARIAPPPSVEGRA